MTIFIYIDMQQSLTTALLWVHCHLATSIIWYFEQHTNKTSELCANASFVQCLKANFRISHFV